MALDDIGIIMEEYGRHLNFRGSPSVGDYLFRHLFNHQYNRNRVHRVTVTLCDDERRGFRQLPENDLDSSDRKFLAVAVVVSEKSEAVIVNATDSDWSEQKELIGKLGVQVEQLCPEHAQKS